MSNRRYLEIDSTYRNRLEDPSQSNFKILISQTGTKSILDSLDPISLATPQISWVPNDVIIDNVVDNNAIRTNHLARNLSYLILKIAKTTNANKQLNYYVGSILQQGTNNQLLITGWQYKSSDNNFDYFIVTTLITSSTIDGSLNTFILTNYSSKNEGIFYVPGTHNAHNFYINHFLWNERLQVGFPIISYDGFTHTIGIDNTNGVVNVWLNTDTLNIRKELPMISGFIATQSPSLNTVFIGVGDSDSFLGNFIRFSENSPNNANQVGRITSYTGLGDATVVPIIPPGLATVNVNFTTLPQVNDPVEMLQYTRDSVVPFTYTGSMVSQQEMVCYEVELVNLVLPNTLLQSGGQISFYPYVYVQLQNISSTGAGLTNIIYSNNPHSTKRLFRASIDDIPNPEISPFIKIDGDGMIQTVKFKINDSLSFGVFLPDGTPFETLLTDTTSPSKPNTLLQISAIFSIKRL